MDNSLHLSCDFVKLRVPSKGSLGNDSRVLFLVGLPESSGGGWMIEGYDCGQDLVFLGVVGFGCEEGHLNDQYCVPVSVGHVQGVLGIIRSLFRFGVVPFKLDLDEVGDVLSRAGFADLPGVLEAGVELGDVVHVALS